MKIKIYFFGKPNEITAWEETYVKRIGHRASLELVALPQAGLKDPVKTKIKEAENLLKKINPTDFLMVLDERGQGLDSVKFSEALKTNLVQHGTVVLAVGGAHGFDQAVLDRANLKIAFGAMVWTRNLVRLMLLEQVYRALDIDAGGHFHKA